MPKMQKKGEAQNVKPEAMVGLGNFILIALMIFFGSIFVFYFWNNKLFVILTLSALFVCLLIALSANFFFYKHQVFFEKWADAIRYSRYPATMMMTDFSMVAFIIWIKANTSVSQYLNLPLFLALTLPFLFSSLCYGLCAYHTLFGNLVDENQNIITRNGRLSIIYWKMGQILLVSALVPMIALVVFISVYMTG